MKTKVNRVQQAQDAHGNIVNNPVTLVGDDAICEPASPQVVDQAGNVLLDA